MNKFVALLRGINVGGNVVLRSTDDTTVLGKKIAAAVQKQFGFTPKVLLLPVAEYLPILAANPFAEAVDDPKSLHIWFLATTPPAPDLQTLRTLKTSGERFELLGKAFYLHAPEGIGRSKLAAKVEKCLGVPASSRNWRTASKIAALAASIRQ